VCDECGLFEFKVPLVCPSTEGVPAHREGRYAANSAKRILSSCWCVSCLRWSSLSSSRILCRLSRGYYLYQQTQQEEDDDEDDENDDDDDNDDNDDNDGDDDDDNDDHELEP
jgi:hypothetical protein